MQRKFSKLMAVAVFCCTGVVVDACQAVNFKTLPIAKSVAPLAATALITAYPGLGFDPEQGAMIMPDGAVLPLGVVRKIGNADRLLDATIAEQFLYPYPLGFDLTARRTPWVDPGRLRNDTFFRHLYFQNRKTAQKSLTKVVYSHGAKATFRMTSLHGVDCQLAAVFAELAPRQLRVKQFFNKIGGSFNWRKIGGTARLSTHSFGIALDLNTKLGQYWKWSGARAGQATKYNNKYPEELVEVFEKYGFIWGGKWHHFDGMHFEYRPELILYARLVMLENEG